jgi:hypothetical protein
MTMQEHWWSNFWDKAPDLMMMTLIFGLPLVVGVVALLMNGWKSNRENERIAILKQQMVEKGMSADDIVRVIQASPPPSPPLEA